jgi:hypothetical protein
MCTPARFPYLLSHGFYAGLIAAGQKHFRAFGGELFGDRGPNGASCAKHDGVLSL